MNQTLEAADALGAETIIMPRRVVRTGEDAPPLWMSSPDSSTTTSTPRFTLENLPGGLPGPPNARDHRRRTRRSCRWKDPGILPSTSRTSIVLQTTSKSPTPEALEPFRALNIATSTSQTLKMAPLPTATSRSTTPAAGSRSTRSCGASGSPRSPGEPRVPQTRRVLRFAGRGL